MKKSLNIQKPEADAEVVMWWQSGRSDLTYGIVIVLWIGGGWKSIVVSKRGLYRD